MATETLTQTEATIKTQSAGPGSVHTTINYYQPPEGSLLPEDQSKAIQLITGDIYTDGRPVEVRDIRDHEKVKKFNIDDNAFEFIRDKSEKLNINFYNNDEVAEIYYPDVEELVKRVTGAKRAQAFQHVYRNAMPVPAGRNGKEAVKQGSAPLSRAHIDLSEAGSRTRLMMHTKDQEELEQVWAAGFMILSVWRPLQTVQRDPLCVMDAQTLPEADAVNFSHDITFKGGKIPLERVTIKADELGQPGKHHWYYCSQQTPEDVLFIKFCDSREGHNMTGCPHTSFNIPGTEDMPPRESIETRVMAFF